MNMAFVVFKYKGLRLIAVPHGNQVRIASDTGADFGSFLSITNFKKVFKPFVKPDSIGRVKIKFHAEED